MSTAQDWISADTMAAAVATDPQFAAPPHPRWPAGLVAIPHADGLLVEGAPSRQTLHGKAARTLVPRAIPLLDGTRDVAALARDLEVPERIAHQLVSLLYTAGLLDDGVLDEDLARDHEDVYAFVSRQIDSTRVNRSGAEAMRRLAAAHVALAGPDEVAGPLRRDLLDSGVGTVDVLAAGESLPDDATHAIGLDVPGGATDLAAVDAACRDRGVAWLRVGLDEGHVEVGPCFTHPASPCFTCFGASRDDDAAGLPAPADAVLATGLAGLQAVRWISRVGTSAPHNGVRRLTFDGLGEQWLPVARRAGCPVCSVATDRVPSAPSLALRFEEAVAFPPRELLNPKDHQHHYKPANLRLQHDVKRYRDAARSPLDRVAPGAPGGALAAGTAGPEASASTDAAPVATSPSGAATASGATAGPAAGPTDDRRSDSLPLTPLAHVLQYAFGRRDPDAPPEGKVARWAPTGGNLGSPNAYLVARDVDGLEPAAYFYDPAAHELVTLPGAGGTPLAVHDAHGALGLEDPGPALLVLTGAVGRVVSKYGAFAYKIVHLDAGAALAQLRFAGHAHGVVARPLARWDDEALGEALGITVDGEPVTAVVALHHQEASA
ncbi:nitroreductase family protein [Patulibacter minatonensis]|uniref:nitroreductase family protein n=1 Tax=Patulibacter minatonensis TaxID=298163 RepID=UPI00047E3F64|nr:nitroreductase family protein [Patulibacter minatonensis]